MIKSTTRHAGCESPCDENDPVGDIDKWAHFTGAYLNNILFVYSFKNWHPDLINSISSSTIIIQKILFCKREKFF